MRQVRLYQRGKRYFVDFEFLDERHRFSLGTEDEETGWMIQGLTIFALKQIQAGVGIPGEVLQALPSKVVEVLEVTPSKLIAGTRSVYNSGAGGC